MCPIGGLDDLERRKIPCRYRDLNPASFSRDKAVTVITTLTVTTTSSRLVYFFVRNSMCVTLPTVQNLL